MQRGAPQPGGELRGARSAHMVDTGADAPVGYAARRPSTATSSS